MGRKAQNESSLLVGKASAISNVFTSSYLIPFVLIVLVHFNINKGIETTNSNRLFRCSWFLRASGQNCEEKIIIHFLQLLYTNDTLISTELEGTQGEKEK